MDRLGEGWTKARLNLFLKEKVSPFNEVLIDLWDNLTIDIMWEISESIEDLWV